MKSSVSEKLILRPIKVLSKGMEKQLQYLNPKGASKRILPIRFRKEFIQLPESPPKSTSPDISSKRYKIIPKSLKSYKTYADIAKNTRTLNKIILTTSRDSSPLKTSTSPYPELCNKSDFSLPRLVRIAAIVDSCDTVSKLNKSDIIITKDLKNQSSILHEHAQDYLDQRRNIGRLKLWGEKFEKKKLKKISIDKIKKESFETAYFVERTLRKTTLKKLKAKVMPWKIYET
ncbi:hypothetical protein SteCoe_5894 [Stentor coeruleus]|uniref:Uncharacterized protein n=1 Tax=Stentor coeruleus TaxID=5963 RepID=A0A1R2CR88_9CILI|nr:hypothetical protein SteCoe_5894 [Stentor coeruleus]